VDGSQSGRDDRLEQLHAQLTEAVEDLARSDAWRRMLEVAARLPSYSPSNVLLIAVQRPDATRVAGYGTWKSLGRQVRKGEKGIAILAPCLYRTGEDRGARDSSPVPGDQEAIAKRELRGFRVVHVFDVSQTDGEPLPVSGPELLTGAAPERLWEGLVRLVESEGFVVERGDCHGANGFTRFDECVVRVREDVDQAQAVKTLAHELGHIRADHGSRFHDTYRSSVHGRGVAEIEAESIAFLVTTMAGIDCGGYSVPYVAAWSGGSATLLRETASRVLSIATVLDLDLQRLGSPTADAGGTGLAVQPPRTAAAPANSFAEDRTVGPSRAG
jgi:antirestriction protein ArdC